MGTAGGHKKKKVLVQSLKDLTYIFQPATRQGCAKCPTFPALILKHLLATEGG